jgi:hypothetical protein
MEFFRAIPALHGEETVVVDPLDHITELYNLPLRLPADPWWTRFPITQGFLMGAPVELIAESLAAGAKWLTGPATQARGPIVMWLLDPCIPHERQIAAWVVPILR